MRMRFAICCLVAFSLTHSVSAARLPGEYMHELRTDVETPHTDWASPYAGGKIRAFFLVPFVCASREVAELAQRMDLDVSGETTMEVTSLGRADGCFPDVQDTSPEEKARRILKKIRSGEYDVFIIANVRFNALPKEIQYEILNRVAQGAGLVLAYRHDVPDGLFSRVNPEERNALLTGIAWRGIPFFQEKAAHALKVAQVDELPNRIVSTYRVRRGRVVQIDYGVRQDFRPCGGGHGLAPAVSSICEYDESYVLVVRAVLWAAKRLPALAWSALPSDGLTLQREEVRNYPLLCMAFNPSAKSRQVRFVMRIRDDQGQKEKVEQRDIQLHPNENTLDFHLPFLKCGRHFVNLWLKSDRGIENFASFSLVVEGKPDIAHLTLAKPAFHRDESVEASVGLSWQPLSPESAFLLRALLTDNYGRQFAEKTFPVRAEQASVDVSLSLRGAVSRSAWLEVELLVAETNARKRIPHTVIGKRREWFAVTGLPQHEFPAILWGSMPGILGSYALERVRELGFNALLASPNADTARAAAMHDMTLVPYMVRLGPDWRLTDEKALESARERIQRLTSEIMLYEPLVYSLGDENCIPGDLGYKPEDQPAFTKFLQDKYHTLARVSEAWGVALSTWEEAKPINASEAREKQRWVQYHDTCAFRETMYANAHHALAAAIRAVHPGARVGAEGSEPGELEQTVRSLEFWGPYRIPWYNTLLSSVAPRTLLRGNWFGGYRFQRHDPLTLPLFCWESLFDGSNMLQYFAINTVEGIFNTDFSPAYWVEWFAQDMRQIQDGIGQLIASSEIAHDGIAIHYSPASWHMSEVASGPYHAREGGAKFLEMFESMGVQCRYITTSQIESGALQQGEVKLLILPFSQVITEKEAAAIKQFAHKGGWVIADMRPGRFGDNCQPRTTRMLDDLFGVAQSGPMNGGFREAPATISGQIGSVSVAPVETTKMQIDPTVTCREATPLTKTGDIPLVMTRSIGRGCAILLNTPPLRPVVQAIVRACGIQPFAQIVQNTGELVPHCRVAHFRRGDVDLVGIVLRRPAEKTDFSTPVSATLRLNVVRECYHSLTGKHLGKTDRVLLQLVAAHGQLIAVSEKGVAGLKLRSPSVIIAGNPLHVEVTMTPPANRLIRLSLRDAAGQSAHWYRQTLQLDPNGKLTAVFPIALNDPPGTWTVTARDIATGLTARRTFTVTRR